MSSSPTETADAPTANGAGGNGASVEVLMPKMGISVSEGTILEWRKRPGEEVAADETIADVTTDKVDVEIPAPASGVVTRLLVEEGETVEVGVAIAEIGSAAEPAPAAGASVSAATPERPAAAEGDEADRSGFYSPVVQRIAAKHRIDLATVSGTGVGGRVRKKDLLDLIEGGEVDERPMPTLHSESPYRPEPVVANGAANAASLPGSPGAVPTAEHREQMSAMRRAIARHMVESRHTAAHCTTVVEADMSAVARERAALKAPLAKRGVRLTYLAFVAEAAVAALAKYPVLNASVEGDELVHHEDVNLGIAVALEEGLIVPVIHGAQRLSVEGLAGAIADLADRARSRSLEPDDVHGGTFTITNPGQFGAVLATPIINQPQVAILDLEAIVKRPVVVEGPDGDSIAIRPMTNLCMSWDHRALDGADAARFLGEVKSRLETRNGGAR